jgi:hypothetical protein
MVPPLVSMIRAVQSRSGKLDHLRPARPPPYQPLQSRLQASQRPHLCILEQLGVPVSLFFRPYDTDNVFCCVMVLASS